MRSVRWRNVGNPAHCTENAPEELSGARRACAQARRVNAQREIAASGPAGQHPSHRGLERRQSSARKETVIGTANTRHSAKHFASRCGRIVLGHGVTPRDPGSTILTSSPFDQPVNKEAVVAQNQHYVSRKDLVVHCALNREQIARPHRGKHARSPRLEVNRAAAAQHFGRETKLRILAIFLHEWHRWPHPRRHSG